MREIRGIMAELLPLKAGAGSMSFNRDVIKVTVYTGDIKFALRSDPRESVRKSFGERL